MSAASMSDIAKLALQLDDLRHQIRELHMRLLQCEARPNAHEPLDNCPNNPAVARHDAEIKALLRQSAERGGK